MYARHRLLFFLLEVAGAIILLTALSPLFSGPYSRLVAVLADLITPFGINVSAGEDVFEIYLPGYAFPLSLHSLPFLGGLVLILALLLVTPGIPLRRRPLHLLAGLASTLVLQAVSLLVMGLLIHFQVSRGLGRSISTLFFSIGIDLFPVAIWLIISFKYWWPVFSRSGSAERPLARRGEEVS